jgi:hypothetical protein
LFVIGFEKREEEKEIFESGAGFHVMEKGNKGE